MADEAPKAQEAVVQVEEVVVTHVPVPEKAEKDPETEGKVDENKKPVTLGTHLSSKSTSNDGKVPESGSFKEESTKLSDLTDNENKALQELKQLVRDALNKHEFSAPVNPPPPPKEEKPVAAEKQDEEKQPLMKKEQDSEAVTDEVPAEPAKTEEVAEKAEEKKEEEEQQQPPQQEVAEKEEEEVKEPTLVAEVEEKEAAASSVADDDGAKTVEAIEETVVSSVPKTEQPPTEQKAPAEAGEESKEKEEPLSPEEVSIWGIPLLADDRSDVILLKFLRARDLKVKEAFSMLKSTIRWRKEFGIDEIVNEDFGDELEKVVFMHGFDKEGHPVCYNIYGEFQNKELYKKAFSDEDKRQRFLRWRIQFLEKSIRRLDFTPGSISTIVQVNDLKNSPGPAKWELRQATRQALQLLQDNYPEFVAKQVFINVPWWYLAVNRMISPFLTQRTKSKFVFAGPSKSVETLLRYIAPEQLPVKYGGLSKDGDFGNSDAVTEITVKPATKHTVEFPVTENSSISWEVRVIGWEVSYASEFVPSSEESYTVIIEKVRKFGSSEEPVLCNSYKTGEPGKVVLTIDNQTSKKKKLLYRFKTKPSPSSA